ncbi:MAG: ATP-binding protein [Phycisphaerae bacterium]|nr:ATP-binding protein [Phycisphaerae bacterium]
MRESNLPRTIEEAAARITRCCCNVINVGTPDETHVGWVRWPGVPVGHLLFGKAIPCACQRSAVAAREADRLRRLSNVPIALEQEMTFEAFEPLTDPLQRALKTCRAFAQEPRGWLILSGSVGTGKTHLAIATAVTARQRGLAVHWDSWPSMLNMLRAGYEHGSKETMQERLTMLQTVGLLVLDDVGSEVRSPWTDEQLFLVLNARLNTRLPTIITSNLNLKEMPWDERIRDRVLDGITVNENGSVSYSKSPWARILFLGNESYRRRREARGRLL